MLFIISSFAQDTIAGFVVVQSRGELAHNGIVLTMEGSVNMQLSAKSVGMFEAFYNSLKVTKEKYCSNLFFLIYLKLKKILVPFKIFVY